MITPESAVLDTEATFVVIPAFDGEVGVLRDHAPLLCRLGIGIMRAETPQGTRRLVVDAGFAEVLDNEVTLLTELAIKPEDIDVSAEQSALSEARSRRAITDEEIEARDRDVARAATRIKAAST